MKKKIVFFVSSLNSGGIERAFVNLANSFVGDGHKVDFIVCRNEGALMNELNPNVNLIDFKVVQFRDSFIKLYKYIRNTSADALITGPTYPNIFAILSNMVALKKMKIIISQHNYHDIEMVNLGIKGKIAPFLIKQTYNKAEKIIAVSQGVKEFLAEEYNISPKKIRVIYNAVIDEFFFEKAKQSIDSSVADIILSQPYLVAVGRLEAVKNYSFMLKAFAEIKKTLPHFGYNLLILGDGTEREKIEMEIIQLGLTDCVFLLGSLANPYPIIRQSKLFIHSSFSEAMPLVYVEALALKVPVVTVINKGATELLKDVLPKKIVSSHNQQEFIDAILFMLNQDFFSKFPTLNEFRSERIREQYLELL